MSDLFKENMDAIEKSQKISNGILKRANGDLDKAGEMMKEHAKKTKKERKERNNKLIEKMKEFDELTQSNKDK